MWKGEFLRIFRRCIVSLNCHFLSQIISETMHSCKNSKSLVFDVSVNKSDKWAYHQYVSSSTKYVGQKATLYFSMDFLLSETFFAVLEQHSCVVRRNEEKGRQST